MNTQTPKGLNPTFDLSARAPGPLSFLIAAAAFVLVAIIFFAIGNVMAQQPAPKVVLQTTAVSANCQDAAKPNNPAYWVSVTRSTALPRWEMKSCVFQDIDTSGGNHNMYISVVNEHGAFTTAYAFQAWPNDPDSPVKQLTLGGQTNFGLYGGSFDPRKGQVGAYSFYIEGLDVSDVVSGVGLPLDQHVNYITTWQRVVAAGTATPTLPIPFTATPTHPGTSTPTPIVTPGSFVTRDELIRILQSDIDQLKAGSAQSPGVPGQ